MTIRHDPVTGNVLCSGGGNWVTPAMYGLAKDKVSWLLAEKILDWSLKPQGGKWFSKWSVGLTPPQLGLVRRGCELEIFKKDEHKEYWRWTVRTRPWILTALALRDEWMKTEEAQRITRFIAPQPDTTATSQQKPHNTTHS